MPVLSAALLEELDAMEQLGRKASMKSIGSMSTCQGRTQVEAREGSMLAPTVISLPAVHLLESNVTDEELWSRRLSLIEGDGADEINRPPAKREANQPVAEARAAASVVSLPAMCLQGSPPSDENLWMRRVSLLTPSETIFLPTWQSQEPALEELLTRPQWHTSHGASTLR